MVRLRAVVAGAAAAGVLAGCGGPAQGPPQEQQPSIGEPATISPAESRSRPTTPVLTREGPCPYFGLEFAQQTIGQHLARSTVTTTRPYPGCTLYRPDGGKAIDIRVTPYPSELAAKRRALTALGAAANPTDVGDQGTVAIVADGTRLVASKGRYLLTVFVNQQSSLQAHDIAAAVAAKIH